MTDYSKLVKNRIFLLTLDGKELEVQMNDGQIFTFTQEPLVKSQKFYSDDQVTFYTCEIGTFFKEIGADVTVRFLREEDPFTAEDLAAMENEVIVDAE